MHSPPASRPLSVTSHEISSPFPPFPRVPSAQTLHSPPRYPVPAPPSLLFLPTSTATAAGPPMHRSSSFDQVFLLQNTQSGASCTIPRTAMTPQAHPFDCHYGGFGFRPQQPSNPIPRAPSFEQIHHDPHPHLGFPAPIPHSTPYHSHPAQSPPPTMMIGQNREIQVNFEAGSAPPQSPTLPVLMMPLTPESQGITPSSASMSSSSALSAPPPTASHSSTPIPFDIDPSDFSPNIRPQQPPASSSSTAHPSPRFALLSVANMSQQRSPQAAATPTARSSPRISDLIGSKIDSNSSLQSSPSVGTYTPGYLPNNYSSASLRAYSPPATPVPGGSASGLDSPRFALDRPVDPEKSVRRFPTLDFFERSEQGARPKQEDTTAFKRVSEQCVLFGVFDGHEGRHAADFCADYTLEFISRHLSDDPTLEECRKALFLGFGETESQFLEMAQANGWEDGTTAVVCCLTKKYVHVAHVGDTRAMVVNEGQPASGMVLTQDHKPLLPAELARIRSVGGSIQQVPGDCPRACPGGYAFSRSIGDKEGKISTCPVLSAVPEINSFEIQPMMKFLVIACDGVWDMVTPQMCVEVCLPYTTSRDACNALIDCAFQRKTQDNATAIVVRLNNGGLGLAA